MDLFSRAAEELTWERLLGLDGSLVFLEHVFWVVSLNTLFILVFAFCPYHIGHFTIVGFKVKSYINGAHFEGMSTTLCGKYSRNPETSRNIVFLRKYTIIILQ